MSDVARTDVEQWVIRQFTDDSIADKSEIVERYGIAHTENGIRIKWIIAAFDDFGEQNKRDWKRWNEWEQFVAKTQQQEAQA